MYSKQEMMEIFLRFTLRIHLYMGRNFPPADETGASDPFVIIRCCGKKVKSSVKYVTLNPGWFEVLEIDEIRIPPPDREKEVCCKLTFCLVSYAWN